jgi:hypothetical protein
MARPKGSKNIPKEEEVVDPILVDEDLVHAEPKPKVLIGYHPITGAEVWQ